jgi:hypothetical protein
MIVFIDETGDHNLNDIDPTYPIFGLGALLISEKEYKKLDKEMCYIKKHYFSDDGTFILHSSELKRPKNSKSDSRNVVMFNAEIRASFYKDIEERIIKPLDYAIVACFVDKKKFASKYKYPLDPYYFSFENLLNRIIKYGDSNNVIFAEKRGDELNLELLAEYERRKKIGIYKFTGKDVSNRTSLVLLDKKENKNGLQLIDLIMASLAKKHLGKREKMNNNDITPELLEKKLASPITYFP